MGTIFQIKNIMTKSLAEKIEESFVNRLEKAFSDLNNINTL